MISNMKAADLLSHLGPLQDNSVSVIMLKGPVWDVVKVKMLLMVTIGPLQHEV